MIGFIKKPLQYLFVKKDMFQRVVKLQPEALSRGAVVISYITWPFREGLDSAKMRGHTNAFEVIAMAESYLELGYRVEICDYENTHYKLPADCVVAYVRCLPIAFGHAFREAGHADDEVGRFSGSVAPSDPHDKLGQRV